MTRINQPLRDRIAAKLAERPFTANDVAVQLSVAWMGIESALRAMHRAGVVRKRKTGDLPLWVACNG